MDTTSYFEIGRIVNAQGLAGEVRVIPVTDDPSRFDLLDEVFVSGGSKNEVKLFTIERTRPHRGFILVKLGGINNRTEAENLIGSLLKIPPEKALPLGEDQYYIRDLLDMEVVTDTGELLGVIADVLQTGANDVYVVKKPGHKDVLIPAIKQCICSVLLEKRQMVVHLLEGLRD